MVWDNWFTHATTRGGLYQHYRLVCNCAQEHEDVLNMFTLMYYFADYNVLRFTVFRYLFFFIIVLKVLSLLCILMAVSSHKVKHIISGKLLSHSRGLQTPGFTTGWLIQGCSSLPTSSITHLQWKKSFPAVSLLAAALPWTMILAPSVLGAKVALTSGRAAEKKRTMVGNESI